MINRTKWWFAFFVSSFIAFVNFLGYFSDLTDVYQTSEGLHVPTFSNTPLPIWLIVWCLISILILVLVIKSIVVEKRKKKTDLSVKNNTENVNKNHASPLFKAIIYLFVFGVAFYVWLILALGGSFKGFFGDYVSGITAAIHNPEGFHLWRIAGMGLIILILIVVAVVDKIKTNRGQ